MLFEGWRHISDRTDADDPRSVSHSCGHRIDVPKSETVRRTCLSMLLEIVVRLRKRPAFAFNNVSYLSHPLTK